MILRVSPSGPEVRFNDTSVPNVAALVALTGAVVGQKVRVETLGRSFELTLPSTSPLEAMAVIDAVGSVGQWHSLEGTSDQRWLDQRDWWIDGSNGNDENLGDSSASAIASDAERRRRWESLPTLRGGAVRTVHLLSTPVDNRVFVQFARENLLARVDVVDASIRNQLAAGIVGTYAVYSTGGNDAALVSVVGVDFTGLVGMRISFGAQGFARVVAANPQGLGVSYARITTPRIPSVDGVALPLIGVPVVGQGAVVESLGVAIGELTFKCWGIIARPATIAQPGNVNGIQIMSGASIGTDEILSSNGIRVFDSDVRDLKCPIFGAVQIGGSASFKLSAAIQCRLIDVMLSRGPALDGLSVLTVRCPNGLGHTGVVGQDGMGLFVYDQAIVSDLSLNGRAGDAALEVHNGGHLYLTNFVGRGNAFGIWQRGTGKLVVTGLAITGTTSQLKNDSGNLSSVDLPRMANQGSGTVALVAGVASLTIPALPAGAVFTYVRSTLGGVPGVQLTCVVIGSDVTFTSDSVTDTSTISFHWLANQRNGGIF